MLRGFYFPAVYRTVIDVIIDAVRIIIFTFSTMEYGVIGIDGIHQVPVMGFNTGGIVLVIRVLRDHHPLNATCLCRTKRRAQFQTGCSIPVGTGQAGRTVGSYGSRSSYNLTSLYQFGIHEHIADFGSVVIDMHFKPVIPAPGRIINGLFCSCPVLGKPGDRFCTGAYFKGFVADKRRGWKVIMALRHPYDPGVCRLSCIHVICRILHHIRSYRRKMEITGQGRVCGFIDHSSIGEGIIIDNEIIQGIDLDPVNEFITGSCQEGKALV